MRNVNSIKKYKILLGDTCINCNSHDNIEYHHIVPLIAGGLDDINNIVPLCKSCHYKAHYKVWRSTKCRRQGRRHNAGSNDINTYIVSWLDGNISNYELCDKLMLKYDINKTYDCYSIRSVKKYMQENRIDKTENRNRVGKIRREKNKEYRKINKGDKV